MRVRQGIEVASPGKWTGIEMKKGMVWVVFGALAIGWCGCESIELALQQRQAYLEAVDRNDVDEVRDLLADGVDVNTTDTKGRTAMKIASCRGHAAMATMLGDHGGKLKIRRPGGG